MTDLTPTQEIDSILTGMNAAGMKQRDLAKALNVSDARISRMLRATRVMRASTIERVHRAIEDHAISGRKSGDWAISRIKLARERIKALEARVEELEQKGGSRMRSIPSPLSVYR